MKHYEELKNFFLGHSEVQLPGPKGAQGLKYQGKMFAMFYKGDLSLKFSPARVQELISSGMALPHDPGTGKAMKDRVIIPEKNHIKWIELTKESLGYAISEHKK